MMHPRKGAIRRALFSFLGLILLSLIVGCCDQEQWRSNQTLVVADVEVTILNEGQLVCVYNGNQAWVTVVGAVWQSDLLKYVEQFRLSLGCHQSAEAKTDFRSGDDIRFMFIISGDTLYRYFVFNG